MTPFDRTSSLEINFILIDLTNNITYLNKCFSNIRIWKNFKIWKQKFKWLVTAAAHNKKTLFKVSEHKIDAFLISPVFSTKSHPNNTQLGVNKLIQWVHQSKIPIYALGGINLKNIQSLKKSGIIGFAFQRGY